MHQRIASVKPAVQALQPIHQPLGRSPVICLPVFKLRIVHPGHKALFVYSLICKLPESAFDHCQKLALLLRPGAFGNHRKIRLKDSAVIPSENILPDTCI